MGPVVPAADRDPHGGGPDSGNLPCVVDLVLSGDGRYLAAAYDVPARNCPGTDWGAWVAVWDLTTGKRTIIPNATHPLAISPDGRWLAMGLYTCSNEAGRGTGPLAEPAIWKTGDLEPTRKLASKIEPGTWLAWTFGDRGKTLLAIDTKGRLLSWELTGQSPGKEIGAVDFEAKSSLPPAWPTRFAYAPQKNLIGYTGPGDAVATVAKINGKRLAQFPAAAVRAFTPDAKQLIASDRRGVLRFWDVATGRIVRTLRLDDKPADTFLVAAIQAASELGQPEENRRTLADLIDRAAAKGAEVVVLPETAVTGYMSPDIKRTWRVSDRPIASGLTGVDPKDAAETVPGPSTKYFGYTARRWGIYLTVPLLEVDRKTGRYYNTTVLLGPDGGILIHYRKLNPWPWAEQGWASEGNLGRPVVDTPFGRFGVLICYDIHKQAEELAKLKIDTLLYSIAWVDDKGSDWFQRRLPKVAASCRYNIVAANWTVPKDGPKPSWHGFGQSRIIDARGNVLASAGNSPQQRSQSVSDQGYVLAELPLPDADTQQMNQDLMNQALQNITPP
jgi:predicted amidohydrolase